jgi:hypothetical protein
MIERFKRELLIGKISATSTNANGYSLVPVRGGN